LLDGSYCRACSICRRVGFIPGCRIVGVSLMTSMSMAFADSHEQRSMSFHRKITERDWNPFSKSLDYVPLGAGAQAVNAAVKKAEQTFDGESRRLHYLSVPPMRRCRWYASLEKRASSTDPGS